jgi:hypothetical protein
LTLGYFFMKAALTARKPASEASELDTMNLRVPDGAPPVLAAGPLVPDEHAARRSEVATTETKPIRRPRTRREHNDSVFT